MQSDGVRSKGIGARGFTKLRLVTIKSRVCRRATSSQNGHHMLATKSLLVRTHKRMGRVKTKGGISSSPLDFLVLGSLLVFGVLGNHGDDTTVLVVADMSERMTSELIMVK